MKTKNINWGINIATIILVGCAFITTNAPEWRWLVPVIVVLIQGYLFFKADLFSLQEKGSSKWKTYRLLTFLGLCFSVAIYYIIFNNQEHNAAAQKQSSYLIFFFMLVFGNYAPKIPFNRHLGIRLPWTIHDEATWRYAHRIAGYASFPCAFLFLFASLLENEVASGCSILLWVLIPAVASYRFYERERKSIL